MKFGKAIAYLLEGRQVFRVKWTHSHRLSRCFVSLQNLDGSSDGPFFHREGFTDWSPSDEDYKANDWKVVPDVELKDKDEKSEGALCDLIPALLQGKRVTHDDVPGTAIFIQDTEPGSPFVFMWQYPDREAEAWRPTISHMTVEGWRVLDDH